MAAFIIPLVLVFSGLAGLFAALWAIESSPALFVGLAVLAVVLLVSSGAAFAPLAVAFGFWQAVGLMAVSGIAGFVVTALAFTAYESIRCAWYNAKRPSNPPAHA